MFRQIRREDAAQRLASGLEVDMNLIANPSSPKPSTPKPSTPKPSTPKPSTPKPSTPVRLPVISEDMKDNVYASIIGDIPSPRPNPSPGRIKISKPVQSPRSETKVVTQNPGTPKTPPVVQPPPTRAEIKARLLVEKQVQPIEPPKPPIAKPAKTPKPNSKRSSSTYVNMLPEPSVEVIDFNDIPTEPVPIRSPKTVKSPKPSKSSEPAFRTDQPKDQKSKKPVPVVDEDYIKQHTDDMEYTKVEDPDEVRIGDHVKYLNKDSKLMHAIVRDKFRDKESDTFRFKLAAQATGGFVWQITFKGVKSMWRRPIVTNSMERTVELIVKFLDLKYDGEFSEFCQDPDRYISIVKRLKK